MLARNAIENGDELKELFLLGTGRWRVSIACACYEMY